MGQFASSIGGSLSAGLNKRATDALIESNNQISEVNARTGNRLRQAGNAASAAEGNLERFVQSVNNNRRLKAGGDAQEALVVNASRANDAQLAGRFSESIRNAEQVGHAAAAQAMNGMAGSVVDMVNTSTALRDSIVRQSVDDAQSQQNYDTSRRAGIIASQMIGGLDASVILDKLDYNVEVAQHTKISKRTWVDKVFMPMGAITGQSVATDASVLSGKDPAQYGKVGAGIQAGVKSFWDQHFSGHATNGSLGSGGTQPSIDRQPDMSTLGASNPYAIYDEPLDKQDIPKMDMSQIYGSW
jgi:hypothetical protein